MKVIIFIFLLLGVWIFRRLPVSEEDIYVNRLVYLKKDSSLFTGKLKVVDRASYYYVNFCEGIPCGEWSEHQRGGSYIGKGRYIEVSEILSKRTIELLTNDTVVVNYFQEGGNIPTDPYYIYVIILKENSFFQLNNQEKKTEVKELIKAIKDDMRNVKLKYDEFAIIFVDAIDDWGKDYWIHYEVKEGKFFEY